MKITMNFSWWISFIFMIIILIKLCPLISSLRMAVTLKNVLFNRLLSMLEFQKKLLKMIIILILRYHILMKLTFVKRQYLDFLKNFLKCYFICSLSGKYGIHSGDCGKIVICSWKLALSNIIAFSASVFVEINGRHYFQIIPNKISKAGNLSQGWPKAPF